MSAPPVSMAARWSASGTRETISCTSGWRCSKTRVHLPTVTPRGKTIVNVDGILRGYRTDTLEPMSAEKTPQTMKAATAAKKLGIYLPAAPAEFQEREISRGEFDRLNAEPPEWLRTLRADGPHPRDEVARKLGVSNSGLARAGVTDAPTTAE